ncbi:hypothetical protein Sme01_10980 [Sphaerisporangium melleum]|uniref:C2H2-type domain-containing protein n=1 Tax=Sphaerisporangium melleum TaxID=321316 RepID=A0A917QSH0_9ACTN|nr:hypothetical protein [Sphaerisporangium melleum]GGK66262.1 hypothetical protein GCM10007964_06640 [Sphaerisporangium melleum]GII68622.1 hypothetical protein Sme01_10980 [Sphaerisporangium melleum]
MIEGFSTRETWPFECPRCLAVWEDEYVVRHLTDSHGNDADVWFRAELLVQPPWSGTRCPACGDTGVKSFPRGYLARHPELRRATPGRPAGPAAGGRTPREVPEVRPPAPVPAGAAPHPAPGDTPLGGPASRAGAATGGRAWPAALARWPLGARAHLSATSLLIGLSFLLLAGLGALEVLRVTHHPH